MLFDSSTLVRVQDSVAAAAYKTGSAMPRIEVNGGTGAMAPMAAMAPMSMPGGINSAGYGGYVQYGGTLAPPTPCATMGAIPGTTYAGLAGAPFASAPTLAQRTGSMAVPAAPISTVSTSALPAVPISTANGLPAQEARSPRAHSRRIYRGTDSQNLLVFPCHMSR